MKIDISTYTISEATYIY